MKKLFIEVRLMNISKAERAAFEEEAGRAVHEVEKRDSEHYLLRVDGVQVETSEELERAAQSWMKAIQDLINRVAIRGSAEVENGRWRVITDCVLCPDVPPVANLTCSCCSGSTKGRQWHNRDIGYGICPKCVQWLSDRTSPEGMRSNYGVAGFHYLETEDSQLRDFNN